jgi:hypothetical protein
MKPVCCVKGFFATDDVPGIGPIGGWFALIYRCFIFQYAVMHKAQVRLDAEKGSIEIEIAIEID